MEAIVRQCRTHVPRGCPSATDPLADGTRGDVDGRGKQTLIIKAASMSMPVGDK